MINIKRQKIGIYRQPKSSNHWNARGTASNSYKLLLYEAGIYPSVDFKSDDSNILGVNKAIADKSRVYISPFTGLPTLSFNGVATLDTLHFHLASAMQSITQSSSSPYQKVFFLASNSGIVKFAQNEGHLFSIAGILEDNDGFIMHNCILTDFTLSIDRDAEGYGRLLKINGTWTGVDLLTNQNIPSNNFINTDFNDYNLFNIPTNNSDELILEGTLGDYDLEFNLLKWKKIEIKFTNNLQVPYRTTSGYAGNYNITQEVNLSIQFILDQYTKNILDLIKRMFVGSIPDSYIVIKNQYPANGLKYFQIEMQNFLIDTNPIGTENNLFIATLSGKLLGGANEPLKITLNDGINVGY